MSHPARHEPAKHGSRSSTRVTFEGGSGFQLAGIVDYASATEETSGRTAPVVVFSHCFTCNKDLKAIVRISRGMAALGITVLRYDMTGLGGSDGDFSQSNFSTNCQDLRAAIRFAAANLGPVTGLVGHSFGGAASMAVAGGEPFHQLSTLSAVATLAAPSDTQHLAMLMERMNDSITTHGHGHVEIGGRRWMIRREMLNDFRSHQLGDLIARIQVPLMILHSPADETVSYDQALRIYQLASLAGPAQTHSPPVSLITLDDADHLLAKRPDDLIYVTQLLAAFFTRHRTPWPAHSSSH